MSSVIQDGRDNTNVDDYSESEVHNSLIDLIRESVVDYIIQRQDISNDEQLQANLQHKLQHINQIELKEQHPSLYQMVADCINRAINNKLTSKEGCSEEKEEYMGISNHSEIRHLLNDVEHSVESLTKYFDKAVTDGLLLSLSSVFPITSSSSKLIHTPSTIRPSTSLNHRQPSPTYSTGAWASRSNLPSRNNQIRPSTTCVSSRTNRQTQEKGGISNRNQKSNAEETVDKASVRSSRVEILRFDEEAGNVELLTEENIDNSSIFSLDKTDKPNHQTSVNSTVTRVKLSSEYFPSLPSFDTIPSLCHQLVHAFTFSIAQRISALNSLLLFTPADMITSSHAELIKTTLSNLLTDHNLTLAKSALKGWVKLWDASVEEEDTRFCAQMYSNLIKCLLSHWKKEGEKYQLGPDGGIEFEAGDERKKSKRKSLIKNRKNSSELMTRPSFVLLPNALKSPTQKAQVWTPPPPASNFAHHHILKLIRLLIKCCHQLPLLWLNFEGAAMEEIVAWTLKFVTIMPPSNQLVNNSITHDKPKGNKISNSTNQTSEIASTVTAPSPGSVLLLPIHFFSLADPSCNWLNKWLLCTPVATQIAGRLFSMPNFSLSLLNQAQKITQLLPNSASNSGSSVFLNNRLKLSSVELSCCISVHSFNFLSFIFDCPPCFDKCFPINSIILSNPIESGPVQSAVTTSTDRMANDFMKLCSCLLTDSRLTSSDRKEDSIISRLSHSLLLSIKQLMISSFSHQSTFIVTNELIPLLVSPFEAFLHSYAQSIESDTRLSLHKIDPSRLVEVEVVYTQRDRSVTHFPDDEDNPTTDKINFDIDKDTTVDTDVEVEVEMEEEVVSEIHLQPPTTFSTISVPEFPLPLFLTILDILSAWASHLPIGNSVAVPTFSNILLLPIEVAPEDIRTKEKDISSAATPSFSQTFLESCMSVFISMLELLTSIPIGSPAISLFTSSIVQFISTLFTTELGILTASTVLKRVEVIIKKPEYSFSSNNVLISACLSLLKFGAGVQIFAETAPDLFSSSIDSLLMSYKEERIDLLSTKSLFSSFETYSTYKIIWTNLSFHKIGLKELYRTRRGWVSIVCEQLDKLMAEKSADLNYLMSQQLITQQNDVYNNDEVPNDFRPFELLCILLSTSNLSDQLSEDWHYEGTITTFFSASTSLASLIAFIAHNLLRISEKKILLINNEEKDCNQNLFIHLFQCSLIRNDKFVLNWLSDVLKCDYQEVWKVLVTEYHAVEDIQ